MGKTSNATAATIDALLTEEEEGLRQQHWGVVRKHAVPAYLTDPRL